MSIVTKTGDAGKTGLMFNRRVSKSHPRIEACGCVDELNAALGLARSFAKQRFLQQELDAIQHELVMLMGEVATENRDRNRYQKAGFNTVTSQQTKRLENIIAEIESKDIAPRGWAFPGGSRAAAALDLARAICRRAERRVCDLKEKGELPNAEILVYLNRLGDLLWLFARLAEKRKR
jgi:cob(I)alamin adenosyltransferase